jgi:hypothetical protein
MSRRRAGALIAAAATLSLLVGLGGSATATGSPASAMRAQGQQTSVHALVPDAALATPDSGQWATDRGNDSRDGWYPDEPGLSPKMVGSSAFGQVFATQLKGEIYAQPLLVGGVVLVATEEDWVYGLNPVTGAIEWSRQVGRPWPDAPLNCGDLTPYMGVTSTPTLDPANGIVYLVDQEYVPGSAQIGWFMQAINPTTGAEAPNFPVQIKGPADNNPMQPFVAFKQLQRPGLLYLDGAVYAAFGSHCDYPPYSGLVVGVSTSGKQTAMWSDVGTGTGGGGGIWQAGGGLVSDGPGQILFASGNGLNDYNADPHGHIPGYKPPAGLADSVVRLVVQPDGSLKATDFFSMYDNVAVDNHDWDLGSPVALPGQFSTPRYPHLLVMTGKEGVVYLLNRDSLDGVGEGPGGRDDVLGEYGPNGAVFSTAGVWPAQGDYVYVSTVNSPQNGRSGTSTPPPGITGPGQIDVYKFTVSATGRPGLRLVGLAAQTAVSGVSGPIVTSDGITSGSAVVWILDGATLLAYGPLPVNGKLPLVGSFFIGRTIPFQSPGVGTNMLYVGDYAGVLHGFGVKP